MTGYFGNRHFGTHYFGRSFFSKGPVSVGRRIVVNAGEISCVANSGARISPQRRGRIETRQCALEEFLKIVDTLPQPMGAIIADCARAGIRLGQGRSGAPKSQAEKTARETAMKEAPQLFSRYLAEAKGRRRNPHSWAREEAAKAVQKRMRELGVANPPAVTTIMKKWKF